MKHRGRERAGAPSRARQQTITARRGMELRWKIATPSPIPTGARGFHAVAERVSFGEPQEGAAAVRARAAMLGDSRKNKPREIVASLPPLAEPRPRAHAQAASPSESVSSQDTLESLLDDVSWLIRHERETLQAILRSTCQDFADGDDQALVALVAINGFKAPWVQGAYGEICSLQLDGTARQQAWAKELIGRLRRVLGRQESGGTGLDQETRRAREKDARAVRRAAARRLTNFKNLLGNGLYNREEAQRMVESKKSRVPVHLRRRVNRTFRKLLEQEG